MTWEKRGKKYASVKKPILSWSDLEIAIISKPGLVLRHCADVWGSLFIWGKRYTLKDRNFALFVQMKTNMIRT